MSNTNPTPISHITAEHSSWLRGISFYQDEIRIMKNRLDELIDQSAGLQFQSRIDEREVDLHALHEAIEKHVHHLERDVETRDNSVTNSAMAEHDSMRDRYYALENAINVLRHEFNAFIVKSHHNEAK